MFLLAPFIMQNFKKILQANPDLWRCAIFGPKMTICHEKIFFGTNDYYFHLPTGPFHCAKFEKIITADPKLWGCTIFGPKMIHLPQTIFFWKKIISFSSTYWPIFFVQNLKKFLVGLVMRICHFGAQNVPFAQMRIFSEKKLISLFLLIFFNLHVKN